jgi:hypothetical protein
MRRMVVSIVEVGRVGVCVVFGEGAVVVKLVVYLFTA